MDKVASFSFLGENGENEETYIFVSSCLNVVFQ